MKKYTHQPRPQGVDPENQRPDDHWFEEQVKEIGPDHEFDPAQTGDYDPTPWCHGCGSMTKAGCNCGPIAEND